MAPSAGRKKKKNGGRDSKSKKQPGWSDDPSREATASHPPSSTSPPSQHQPPPSLPTAAPDHDASSSPLPGVSGGAMYLSEEEKDIICRVLSVGNGDACDATKHLKGAVMLEEIDGRVLLRHFLDLLSYSLPRTMVYIKTLEDLLEKKKKAIYTSGSYMDLLAAAMEDLEDNFVGYRRMTKLLLKKAKHDQDRTEEGGGSSSSSSGAGGACGEPLNS